MSALNATLALDARDAAPHRAEFHDEHGMFVGQTGAVILHDVAIVGNLLKDANLLREDSDFLGIIWLKPGQSGKHDWSMQGVQPLFAHALFMSSLHGRALHRRAFAQQAPESPCELPGRQRTFCIWRHQESSAAPGSSFFTATSCTSRRSPLNTCETTGSFWYIACCRGSTPLENL